MSGVILLCVFVSVPIVFAIVFSLYYFFGKGKKIKITVLKKKKNGI